jgi:hypothetical protein
MFLDDDNDEVMGKEEEREVEEIKNREVEEYLLLSQVPSTMIVDLLGWWKSRSKMWPNLSKMARQLLALPATSGCVERFLTAGGVMHGDLRKRLKEDILDIQLFVKNKWLVSNRTHLWNNWSHVIIFLYIRNYKLNCFVHCFGFITRG